MLREQLLSPVSIEQTIQETYDVNSERNHAQRVGLELRLEMLLKIVGLLACEVKKIKQDLGLFNDPQDLNLPLVMPERIAFYEAQLIRAALRETGYHQMRAAKLLGVKPTTLNCKIKKYKLNRV